MGSVADDGVGLIRWQRGGGLGGRALIVWWLDMKLKGLYRLWPTRLLARSCLAPHSLIYRLPMRSHRLHYSIIQGLELDRLSCSSPPNSTSTGVVWSPPEAGWIKLKSDGARRSLDGFSACGRVLRDHVGSWKGGFVRAIGLCSTLDAELWGVFTGLLCAWNMYFCKIVLEVNSMDAYRLTMLGGSSYHSFSLLAHIMELCDRD
ncbi:hypothetical protein V6N13_109596 [Hibiscus sabdariffa]